MTLRSTHGATTHWTFLTPSTCDGLPSADKSVGPAPHVQGGHAPGDRGHAPAVRSGHHPMVSERMLTEREAFHAARYFIEQFNERERYEGLYLWVADMAEEGWPNDPEVTADPAQWHDWVACVDRVLSER